MEQEGVVRGFEVGHSSRQAPGFKLHLFQTIVLPGSPICRGQIRDALASPYMSVHCQLASWGAMTDNDSKKEPGVNMVVVKTHLSSVCPRDALPHSRP